MTFTNHYNNFDDIKPSLQERCWSLLFLLCISVLFVWSMYKIPNLLSSLSWQETLIFYISIFVLAFSIFKLGYRSGETKAILEHLQNNSDILMGGHKDTNLIITRLDARMKYIEEDMHAIRKKNNRV